MAGQIIAGGGNAATVAGVDDVYVVVNPPNSVQLPGAATNIGGAVGSASWGPLNASTVIGSGQDLINAYGPPTTAAFDMPTDINIMLQSGANNLRAVRVSDGTDVATVLKVNDNTGFATGTLTVAGTFSAATLLSTTITPATGSPVTVNYQILVGDTTLNGAATSFANAINVSPAVLGPAAFLQSVTTPVAGAVILKALAQGTAGNTIATTASATGGTTTITPTVSTPFTGGLAPGVLATLVAKYTGSYGNAATNRVDAGSSSTTLSPTFKVTLTFPNAVPEVYDNIVAYAAVGGGFVGATLVANLVNAINASPQLNAGRPASAFFVATAGASVIAPVLATSSGPVTLGADGATGLTTAQAIGSATAVPPTGTYALQGQINGGQFCLSGNTDLANASAAATTFALNSNAHFVAAFPKGTSTSTAIANKQLYGLNGYSASVYKDFIEFTDSVNNIAPRSISPAAFVVAKMCTTSPETSPANTRIGLVTGTERTGYATNNPYSPAELALLEAAGINLIANPSAGGSYFSIRHNKNSFSGDPSRFNIAYSTMTKFLAQAYASSLIGQFIGLAQSKQPNDPLREKVRAAYNDFNERLKAQGLIDSHTVKCDLVNNSAASIGAGVLRVDIVVAYLAIVDRIVVTLSGGQTVKINVNPSQLSANS